MNHVTPTGFSRGRPECPSRGSRPPQGGSASPLLANVYLHYVLDRWARQWRKRHARGDMIIVRFADLSRCRHKSAFRAKSKAGRCPRWCSTSSWGRRARSAGGGLRPRHACDGRARGASRPAHGRAVRPALRVPGLRGDPRRGRPAAGRAGARPRHAQGGRARLPPPDRRRGCRDRPGPAVTGQCPLPRHPHLGPRPVPCRGHEPQGREGLSRHDLRRALPHLGRPPARAGRPRR
jgi:hypothetical protein